MSSQGLLRRSWSKGKGRWECSWDFTDVRRVINTASLPPLQGSRDPYKVKGLYPYLIVVIHAYLDQLLSQPNLDFFYPEIVGCLPRELHSFLDRLSDGFGFL